MMKKMNSTRRGGFTLVEMLVVIAIIGILAAILAPALYIAVIAAKQNKIGQEVNQLAMHVETYKQQHGDYPPDFTNAALVLRHVRKAFGRHKDAFVNTAMTLPNGLDAQHMDATGNLVRNDIANLDPSEALVFWLGMLKNDQRFPLNGTSRPVPVYPFDEKRLIDLDGDGWLSYVPPDGKNMPYVYFDSRTYANAALYDSVTATPVLYPYMTATDETTPVANWTFANKTTFQIISAGLDGEYGEVTLGTYKLFPFGNNYKLADLDNIANFSDIKIFEDKME